MTQHSASGCSSGVVSWCNSHSLTRLYTAVVQSLSPLTPPENPWTVEWVVKYLVYGCFWVLQVGAGSPWASSDAWECPLSSQRSALQAATLAPCSCSSRQPACLKLTRALFELGAVAYWTQQLPLAGFGFSRGSARCHARVRRLIWLICELNDRVATLDPDGPRSAYQLCS